MLRRQKIHPVMISRSTVWSIALVLAAFAGCRGLQSERSFEACRQAEMDPADVSRAVGAVVIAVRGIAGDRESCEFVTGNALHVQMSVRPGMGRVTVGSWTSGRMPLRAVLVSGVGDSAVWQPDLRELIAERDDVLCDVSVTGAEQNAGEMDRAGDALGRRFGDLCNKVFALSRNGNSVRDSHSTRR